MKTFDRLVQAFNAFLFDHAFMDVDDWSDHADQHRDLARMFFAGVLEMLIVLDDKASGAEIAEDYTVICHPGWTPAKDGRFRIVR